MKALVHALGLCLVILCSACAHGSSRGSSFPAKTQQESISDFSASFREFLELRPEDPRYDKLRERLAQHLNSQSEGLIYAADYDTVVEHLARLVELYTPDDFERGRLPRALVPVARFVAKEGSKRGDEPRVLAAYKILSKIEGRKYFGHRYKVVKQWGLDAREHLSDVARRYGELINIWEEHARLSPSPEVLSGLVDFYIKRRDVFSAQDDEGGQYQFQHFVRVAPIEVAAVYLRYGDVETAQKRVQEMSRGSELDKGLLKLLKQVSDGTPNAPDALGELIDALRIPRPGVAQGMCRYGLRRFPWDVRFSTCLARIAADSGDSSDSIAWYVRAIEQAPGQMELYDELLVRLDRFIEQKIIDPHPVHSQKLAQQAEETLRKRQARWPRSEPPLLPERLHFLSGMLAMNAGLLEEARKNFVASIDKKENASALVQLGLLLQRTGRTRESEARFVKALKATSETTRAEKFRRAEIYQHLGSVTQELGIKSRARRRYEQALEIWTELAASVEGPTRAVLQTRRAIAFDSMGRRERALRAFQDAMGAAPEYRETYAAILSHLVIEKPDLEVALRTYRRAKFRTNLTPDWKVYFALWVKAIAKEVKQDVDPQIDKQLKRLARSEAWWGQLAKFSVGEISGQELIKRASNPGEKAEAHFYYGASLLGQGRNAEVLQEFRAVLATKMVNFYEYEMARKLSLNLQ